MRRWISNITLSLLLSLTATRTSIIHSVPPTLKLGEFVSIMGWRQLIFVTTDGEVQEVLKGGVLKNIDDGNMLCEVAIKEYPTSFEINFYKVECSRLVPSDLTCPKAVGAADSCGTDDIICAAQSLYLNGYVVIEGPVPGFPGREVADAFAQSKLHEMKALARAADMDTGDLDFHFSDVSSRGPGRWEISVRYEDLIARGGAQAFTEKQHWLPVLWDSLEKDVILPVLKAALHQERTQSTLDTLQQAESNLTAVFDGVLVSVAGADTQHWHRDSGLHTEQPSHYTVYVATWDVTQDKGPTQFLPGTNRDFGFRFQDWTSFFDHCPTLRAPLLRAGDALIWDYRTVHRGSPNIHPRSNAQSSAPDTHVDQESVTADGEIPTQDESLRAMLYRTYHLQGAWRDINMGSLSFFELTRPYWREQLL